jgi:hypothetical protein
MGKDENSRRRKVWSDISHEFRSFLNNQNLATDASTFDESTIMGELLGLF